MTVYTKILTPSHQTGDFPEQERRQAASLNVKICLAAGIGNVCEPWRGSRHWTRELALAERRGNDYLIQLGHGDMPAPGFIQAVVPGVKRGIRLQGLRPEKTQAF